MNQQTLLRRAHSERNQYGFIGETTRLALEDIGMTAADIESALIKLETTNG
jgi:hypothetical protein